MSLEHDRLAKNAYARKLYAEKRQIELERRAIYNEEHKEEIEETKKQTELLNKELNKNRCKEYRTKHEEKVKATRKQHYDNNREKLLEKQKDTIKCGVCGCETTKHHLARHKRSNKCKEQAQTTNVETIMDENTSYI